MILLWREYKRDQKAAGMEEILFPNFPTWISQQTAVIDDNLSERGS